MKKQTSAPKKKSVVGDVLLYRKLEQIEKLMVVQQKEIRDEFDKLTKMIVRETAYVDPELEHEIKASALHSRHIDEKVPDIIRRQLVPLPDPITQQQKGNT